MKGKHDDLLNEFLEKIGNMLYQDNKYGEKQMAETIIKLLEEKYDL